MSCYTCFTFLCLLSSFLTSFTVSAQDPTYVYHDCPNTTTFTRNSTYFTNLRTLLSSLSSRNASYSTGFQNATAGQAPDMVTGLFLCRGDLSPEVCRSCVAFSVNDVLSRCPNNKEVVLYYDECMLRYSHQNILSTLITAGAMSSRNDSSNQFEGFNDVLLSTLNTAVRDAASSSRKFDARKANFEGSQTFYGLVQCTPDLTRQDCSTCLLTAINLLPSDRLGGKYLMPSCNSRFEFYPFYNQTNGRSSRSSPPERKGANTNVGVIAIVLATIVVVLLLIAIYSFLAKRTNKAYNTTPAFDDEIATADSLQLDYRMIQAATNDFSESNNIGRGGFGEVYKGTFPNGTEVAVKRLSKISGQGETEFKNEVVVVAKLKHKNLVKLLGFSLEQQEDISLRVSAQQKP